MIQANELRIGNYLYYEGTTQLAKVQLLNAPNVIGCRDEYGSFTPNGKYAPIPLTEEILVKCEFRWSDPLTLYCLDEADIICDSEDFKNEEDGDGQLYSIHFYHDGEHLIVENSNENGEYGNMRFGKIKHLHQLQNLFYALCGKELEVNI